MRIRTMLLWMRIRGHWLETLFRLVFWCSAISTLATSASPCGDHQVLKLNKDRKAFKERKHRWESVQRLQPRQFQRLRVVMTKLKLDKDRTTARVRPSLQFLQARVHFYILENVFNDFNPGNFSVSAWWWPSSSLTRTARHARSARVWPTFHFLQARILHWFRSGGVICGGGTVLEFSGGVGQGCGSSRLFVRGHSVNIVWVWTLFGMKEHCRKTCT